jgi:hypothetical protein
MIVVDVLTKVPLAVVGVFVRGNEANPMFVMIATSSKAIAVDTKTFFIDLFFR